VFSSPDSALREVREHALKDNKILIMATPKIKEGYLLINPQKVVAREKIASTIKGAFQMGERIRDFPQIDLVVEGSLAVDLEGNRLGKGGGFADQEISHLSIEGAIQDDTPICTPLHPLQIINQVPIEDHDQQISMIVTPIMVIRTDLITLKQF
jgi:5-formyltetrahydrofolate cyclo-ligase